VAEFWPTQRSAEKAQNGASKIYGARSKARRFAIMFVLIPCLIPIRESGRLQIDPARRQPIYSTNARDLMLFVRKEFFFSGKRVRSGRL
jgi:hypothetical protein